MKSKLTILCISICLLLSLCGCVINNPVKISDSTIDDLKKDYEDYLAKTYPDETFTVDVWQEKDAIATVGLPAAGYKGYVIRSVITDSEGNRFKIITSNKKYFDDRDMVLDCRREYNEKGQRILRLDDGSIIVCD